MLTNNSYCIYLPISCWICCLSYVKLYKLLLHCFISISRPKTKNVPGIPWYSLPIAGPQGSLRTAWVKAETYVVALGAPKRAPGSVWRYLESPIRTHISSYVI